MRRFAASAATAVVLLCTGCASVTQGMRHSLRVDTATAAGQPVDGADCTLDSGRDKAHAKSGETIQVRRSSEDLHVVCKAAGQPDAQARLVSRANIGLAGNILVGGAVGAVVDHNTGAAYTYPTWVRLTFGTFAVFDRRDEQEGTAMVAPADPIVQGVATTPLVTGAAGRATTALSKGDSFGYRVTDRASHRVQTVVLRAERVDGSEVTFNEGARVESTAGQLVRLNAAMVGELDQVTPPGGWMSDGRTPSGRWKMKHRSIVPSSAMRYDLDAWVEGEQTLRVAGQDLRTLRIGLRGWAENAVGMVPARARYEATAWLAPELRRVVRYEAKARAAGNAGGGFFEIDEVAELVRIGAD
jgi:hypothetical protein